MATSEEPDVADLDMWQIDCDIPMTNGDALKEIKVNFLYNFDANALALALGKYNIIRNHLRGVQ